MQYQKTILKESNVWKLFLLYLKSSQGNFQGDSSKRTLRISRNSFHKNKLPPYSGENQGRWSQMKFIPHPYQEAAIQHILTHPEAAALLDMGLG